MKKSITSMCVGCLLGVSSLSHAAIASTNLNVMDMNSLMKPTQRFELVVGALFFQPSSTNLDYAVLGYPFPVQSPHWDIQSVRPSHSVGVDLLGRYYIPNTDYDVAASWNHLDTSDSDFTQVATGSGQFVTIPFQAGPSFGQTLNEPSQKALSTVKFNYDVVNLDVGKNILFSPRMLVRFFIGLSVAQLKQNISTTFGDNANTFSINSTNNSKFTGAGPLVGIDANYKFPCGVGFFGSLIGSALVGTLDAQTNYASTSPQLTASGIGVNYQSISPRNSTQGIPGVDARLGVDYSRPTAWNSIFTASLGYAYATYFNAIATYNPAVVAANINTGSIALSSLSKTMSNYTVQGPFLNFGVKFG